MDRGVALWREETCECFRTFRVLNFRMLFDLFWGVSCRAGGHTHAELLLCCPASVWR
jgi:hypothetical protein